MSPIEAYVGPMFSGKSSHLEEDIGRRKVAGQIQGTDFLVFNHFSDTRYGSEIIATHNERIINATPIRGSKELLRILFNVQNKKNELVPEDIKEEYLGLQAIYIDEVQFFDLDIGRVLALIDELFLRHPKRKAPLEIVVAGLDMDFRGEPFGPIPNILARAQRVTKLTAVCKLCDKDSIRMGTRTQRIINDQPADYHSPIILVGGKQNYTARCPEHHEVPGKPLFKNK